MFLIAFVALVVIGLLAGLTLAAAARMTDQDEARLQARERIREQVQRAYWRQRHPDNWWPGR